MAGRAAVLGDPAAGSGVEGVARFDRLGTSIVSDEVRGDAEDHRGLPFAGVTHLALMERGVRFPRAGAEAPVGAEQEEQVGSGPMALPEFEDGLASGDVVSAVAVQEHNPMESVGEEVPGESGEEVEVGAWWRGKGALEVEMVIGVSEPGQRREQDLVPHLFLYAADDFTEEHAVGEEGKVVAVLLEGGDRNHHRRGPGKGRHGGPGKIREFHGGN